MRHTTTPFYHPASPFDMADLELSHSGLVSGFGPQPPPLLHICECTAPTPPPPYLHQPTTIPPPLPITPKVQEDQQEGACTYVQPQHQQQHQQWHNGSTNSSSRAGVAAGMVAAEAGCYGPLPCLFLHFKSNIYMYIQYFNHNKLWVPKVPWVSYSTAQMTGRDRYYSRQQGQPS